MDRASAVEGLKVVFVHAINPWAFSHKTRATENNVDLNRNFLTSGGFGHPNPSYDRLAPFLHGSAEDALDHIRAFKGYGAYLDAHGSQLENESWEGQGTQPDGIFYTGTRPEWSNLTFRRILAEHLSKASSIGVIDWHTGIGKYGEVVPLIFDDLGSELFDVAASWWQLGHRGEAAFKTGTAPRYNGLLLHAIRQELPTARVAGGVVEFGTVDDYALFRADRLDRWLRFEGRGDPDHDRMREDYLDALCPKDVAWRRFVLSKGPEIIDLMVNGICNWR